MTKVTVYSKLHYPVEFRTHKSEKVKRIDGAHDIKTQVLSKVVIQGVTRFLHSNGKKITLLNQLAKTEVDKDIWDAIMKENEIGNVHLRKKQVFVAKNDAEAQAMLNDVPKFISDMLTPADLKKRKTETQKLI